MSKVMEYTRYLSEELGPRPTGTEEEQQAALYIAEKLQQDAGLPAVIEDFNSEGEESTAMNICAIVSFLCVLLSMFIDVLALPAIVITLISAFLVFSETRNKPILSKLFKKNISQNVVATYNPNYGKEQQSNRARKIVLVAHYDSGRTRGTLDGPLGSMIPLIDKISLWSIIVAPIFLLIRNLFFAHALGVLGVIMSVLSIILLICIGINLVRIVMFKLSKYNNAANNNATGVAVMMDLAARINNNGEAMPNSAPYSANAVIHGSAAAYAAGVVDEGVNLEYEDDYDDYAGAGMGAAAVGLAAGGVLGAAEAAAAAEAIDPNSPDAGLMAAKAAIAAMTGKPVTMVNHMNQPPISAAPEIAYDEQAYEESSFAQALQADLEASGQDGNVTVVAAGVVAGVVAGAAVGEAVQGEEGAEGVQVAAEAQVDAAAQPDEGAAEVAGAVVVAAGVAAVVEAAKPEEPEKDDSNLPDWFKRAQKNAKRKEDVPVQRSVYNDALDAANNPVEPEPEPEPEVIEAVVAGAVIVGAQDAGEGDDVIAGSVIIPAEGVEVKEAEDAEAAEAKVQPVEAEAQPEEPEEEEIVGRHVQGAKPEQVEEEPVRGRHAQQKEIIEEIPVPAVERPTVLPNMNTSTLTPIDQEALKQRAPLADAAGEGGRSAAAKGLLTLIPEINLDDDASLVNPLAGAEGEKTVLLPPAPQNIPGMMGSFASVNETLLESSGQEEDLYVDDADEGYGDGYDDFNAYGNTGFVDMPKKKKGLFGKLFGRKKKEEEMSTSEWLGVDESFDAREVGKARGGWESFRDDSYNNGYDGYDTYDGGYDNNYNDGYNTYNDYQENYNDGGDYNPYRAYNGDKWEEDERWNGGAFGFVKGLGKGKDKATNESRKDKKRRGRKQDVPEDDFYGDEYADYGDGVDGYGDGYGDEYGEFSNFEQGSYAPRLDDFGDEDRVDSDEKMYDDFYMQPDTNGEALKEIFEFRNSSLDTEVWFVALGSENANHSGMKSFMKEHAHDLHGAIIIEIDALGAGDLSYISNEGRYSMAATSSRMKRYVDKAAAALNMYLNTASIPYLDSAASVANKSGLQALHLVGMNGTKPALLGQYDDTFDAVDEELILQNEEFVLELMKSI